MPVPPPVNQPSSRANVQSVALLVMCHTARAGPPLIAPVLPSTCAKEVAAARSLYNTLAERLRAEGSGIQVYTPSELVPKDGPDIVIKPDPEGGFVATFKGDRRRPRPAGRGATWQAAAKALQEQKART